jgi:pimeloyl-ACP methyl ester carboxylesterase
MTVVVFTQRRAGDAGLPYHEAGAGQAVVAIVGEGEAPTRAHALLAEQRHVIVFAPPAGTAAAGTAREAARRIGEALASSSGADRFDLIGEGKGAETALWLALAPEAGIGSIVLVAPDGALDDAFRQMTRPVLLLCGTKDRAATGDDYARLLPDCHRMLVYDAGASIGADRPEALASIAAEFFERRDLFLVSRESGRILP